EQAGETAAYLRDLRLAWALAEGATDELLTQGGLAASIGLEVRYALMSASIADIAKNIPAALLIALVVHRLWTPAQALAYAKEIPMLPARSQGLAALAQYLP